MNTSTLCVGADVHLKEITLRAVDKLTSDEVIAPFNVANNLPGAQSAASRLAEVAIGLGYTRIEIGCEATGMLWIPLRCGKMPISSNACRPRLGCTSR